MEPGTGQAGWVDKTLQRLRAGDTSKHHGGKHRATVGPLPLRQGTPYSIQVLSAYFQPSNFSIVHTHSGPEAWWVLEGEQCLETTKAGIRSHAGEGAIVEEGETMRMVGIGTGPRRSLVVVLHGSNRPPATIVDRPPPLKSCPWALRVAFGKSTPERARSVEIGLRGQFLGGTAQSRGAGLLPLPD